MWDKIKIGLKWIGGILLAIVAVIIGKKIYELLGKEAPKEISGEIVNPSKKKDQKEADRVKADREELEKDI